MSTLVQSTPAAERPGRRSVAPEDSPSKVLELAARLEQSLGSLSSLSALLEAAHEDAARASLYDPLTKLPNRVLFNDRLEQMLRGAKRTNNCFPLLVVDLDHFKEINESFGYQAGDDLLCEVARRLCETLRDSDTVARLGSDDFGVLLGATHSIEGAIKAAKRICNDVAAKATIAGAPIDVLLTVGVAMFPNHGTDADTLLRHADIALGEARRARVPYAVFTTVDHDPTRSTLRLAADLRSAVENDELVLHYQPKVCMLSGRTIGVEALVRWQHPKHGLVMPCDFMPIAERSALITPMSLKILDKALAQCRLWLDSGLDVPVAVNLSARSLHQTDLPDRVAEALRTAGIGADRLSFEITETAIMIDEEGAETGVRRLADLGVRISIDDFGTGYSSLARLRRLPVSELKVDRSFVREMTKGAEDAAIVHALVDLGHRLGKTIVAEGVEDEDTMRLLTEWGCDAAQGYHLCRPAPADTLSSWLITSPRGCRPSTPSAPAPSVPGVARA